MPILLDAQPLPSDLAPDATLDDALTLITRQLPPGQVIVKVELDGQPIDGPALTLSRTTSISGRDLAISTADQKQLALTMLGKLHALIQWLAPQHAATAQLLEKGQIPQALEKLAGLLSAWQQIQTSYTSLLTLLHLGLEDLPVRDLTADTLMSEFRNQLLELQTALQNKDYVLLADILQYEMDGVVANWTALLESTLAQIAPEGL
jgi:hypothetical protein